MAVTLDVNSLATAVSNAVSTTSTGTTDDLATGISVALTNWFRHNLFPIMIGVAVFITVLFVFYGSFLYFTAYGDENRATQAKKTITYAFVGFFIAAVALGITNYTKRILISQQYEQEMTTGSGAGGAGTAGGATGGGRINTTRPGEAVNLEDINPGAGTDYNFNTK